MGKVVRNALATVLVGALLGFIVTALGGPLIQEVQWFGNRESAEARRYMVGILENEPDTLASLTPRGDLVSRSLQYKMSQESQGQWRPISLTYLGGLTKGGISIQTYAIELRSGTGREQFVPLALTLANGKVVRRE